MTVGVIRRQPERLAIPRPSIGRQLGQPPADLRQPVGVGGQRRQVRLGEVAVVVRLLLGAHDVRRLTAVVPAARLLAQRLARVEGRGLSLDLVGDRTLDRAERVHVLDLDPRAERLGAVRPDRDIRLDAHLAALHVGVGDADRAQQQLQLLGVAAGVLGRADVGLGHDLHERHAGPVEVDQADPLARGPGAVDELRRVLFEMGAPDPDGLRPGRGVEREAAVGRQRQLELADLVALGQVRVEVVLAIPARRRRGRSPRRRGRWRGRARRRARLIVGSAPGRPRQTGQVWVFGAAPSYAVEQPQNILLAVRSWQWTSMPTTTSKRSRAVPVAAGACVVTAVSFFAESRSAPAAQRRR